MKLICMDWAVFRYKSHARICQSEHTLTHTHTTFHTVHTCMKICKRSSTALHCCLYPCNGVFLVALQFLQELTRRARYILVHICTYTSGSTKHFNHEYRCTLFLYEAIWRITPCAHDEHHPTLRHANIIGQKGNSRLEYFRVTFFAEYCWTYHGEIDVLRHKHIARTIHSLGFSLGTVSYSYLPSVCWMTASSIVHANLRHQMTVSIPNFHWQTIEVLNIGRTCRLFCICPSFRRKIVLHGMH